MPCASILFYEAEDWLWDHVFGLHVVDKEQERKRIKRFETFNFSLEGNMQSFQITRLNPGQGREVIRLEGIAFRENEVKVSR